MSGPLLPWRSHSWRPSCAATLEQIVCVFRPGSVSGADLALRSFAGFFVETAPDVAGIADITRRHVEGRRLPGLLAPGLEEAVARVSAEEAATLTVDSLIVSGSGGRIYSPTNEGFITLQMKPATG